MNHVGQFEKILSDSGFISFKKLDNTALFELLIQYLNPQSDDTTVRDICTHLGCSPSEKFAAGAASGMGDDWPGGFLCPSHGSIFDLAGRVFRNQPAPTNLEVPPYRWLSDSMLLIGDDDVTGAA